MTPDPVAIADGVSRRGFMFAVGGLMVAGRAPAAGEGTPTDVQAPPEPPSGDAFFESVVELARAAAAAPYAPRKLALPAPFAGLSYDDYRGIRFREERRIWATENRGFQIDLLAPGFHYDDRVEIALVRAGDSSFIPFDATAFDFAPDRFDVSGGQPGVAADSDITYSGFRLRFPINRPDYLDEFVVFQGASYFRAVARNQIYGLSARGLAIGTASERGEEFPVFHRFWIHEPAEGATSIVVQALLDSPSLSGAYEFIIRPGAETTMEVRSMLFAREEIREVGIAPLTSMFFFGPRSRAGINDFRDAAHDSTGLQIVTGQGERIWRPLANPSQLQVATFVDSGPKGFGLVQRQRRFEDYQDAEARYEKRPSAWVAPTGDWGPGGVALIEIPSPNEFNDNIVAFWRPRAPLAAGGPHAFGYRLIWSDLPPDDAPLARVLATRGGVAVNNAEHQVFVIDYALSALGVDALTPVVAATSGKIASVAFRSLPIDGAARVSIDFAPEQGKTAEFRVVLNDAEARPASETLIFRWTPA